MKKIWSKKGAMQINQAVENYTVGIDYLLDLDLLPYDLKGTMAHAKMLHKIKYLIAKNLKPYWPVLNEILSLWEKRKI